MPPLHVLPGLLAFAVLVWRLEHADNAMRAARTAWLFAFGFHVAGLYWISNALLVDGNQLIWLVPFAAAGIPAILALFPAVTLAFLPHLCRAGPMRPVAVVVLWCLADYARGHLFTGLPWNLPVYALSGVDALSQAAAWFGAYGVSLLLLLAAVAPAIPAWSSGHSARVTLLAGLVMLAIPPGLWIAGTIRLHDRAPVFDTDTVVRIVQGNVPQKDKWDRALRRDHIDRYLTLSSDTRAGRQASALTPGTRPTVVIWPETAVPAALTGDPALRAELAAVVPEGGSLVAGAPTLTDDAPRRLYNSMVVLDADGTVSERYDKSHLVPFGEYVPGRNWLPLPRVVQASRDFSPGSGLRTVAIAGLGSVSPLICYEVIFPGAVVASTPGPRPRALLNLTNDAWYGRSAGPWQHSAIARMRAVEEGIPLIRVANTGVSGIYDAFGRTVVEIPLEETAAADSFLPLPLSEPPLFARIGDGAFLVMLGLLAAVLLACRILRRPDSS